MARRLRSGRAGAGDPSSTAPWDWSPLRVGYHWGDRQIKSGYRPDLTGGGGFAVPENDWITEIDDTTDTVGASVSLGLIPERLSLSALS